VFYDCEAVKWPPQTISQYLFSCRPRSHLFTYDHQIKFYCIRRMGEKVIASISAFLSFFFCSTASFLRLHVPPARKKQFVVISLRFHRRLARWTVTRWHIRIRPSFKVELNGRAQIRQALTRLLDVLIIDYLKWKQLIRRKSREWHIK